METKICKYYQYKYDGMFCEKGMDMRKRTVADAPCFSRNARVECEFRQWEETDTSSVAELFNNIVVAKALIVLTGSSNGYIPCPVCGKMLKFSVASNGHTHGVCGTPSCLAWCE